ncbi:MAG: inverse autotransporter beta domain-containing protein [Rhabdochlamydiaceae bacterium]
MRVSARYTSPKGVGYDQGYTTLETFLSPWDVFNDKWLPFVDGRGHIFDNGKWAANAGLGVRYLSCSRVWGINSYYDYRNTQHRNYNQVSVGLETLGTFWDLRINGYLPVGKTHTRLYETRFKAFKENSMLVSSKRQFAMKGINAEAGFHVDHFRKVPLYFAAGPYYLSGKGASTWGGEFRARVDLLKHYVRLEGNTSYDHFFKWTGQGQISINIPFGGRDNVKKRGDCCRQAMRLSERIVQPVDRSEIIPVGKQRVTGPAINPATGEPFFFIFVNNTSHSLGTFESPYPTLLEAQNASSPNDVIFVFPGDGSTTGMNAGITLQNGQMLLGAASKYSLTTTLGTVSVPALAASMPILTNTTTAPVVTLANNNTVSGLQISNVNGNGISGTGITNFTATQNSFIGGNAATGAGEAILLNNISGQLTVDSNLFVQISPQTAVGYAAHIAQTVAQCNASFNNNTFFNQRSGQNMNGIFANLTGTGAIGTLNINNNSFASTSNDQTAVQVTLAGSGNVSNINISNSEFNYWDVGVEVDLTSTGSVGNITYANNSGSNVYWGLYTNQTGSGSIENVNVSNSAWSSGASDGEYGLYTNQTGSGSITNVTLSNCTFNNSEYAIYTNQTSSGSITNLAVSNSNFTGGDAALYHDLGGTASITNLTLSNCNINGIGDYAIYADITAAASGITNLVISDSTFNLGDVYALDLSLSNSSSLQNLSISGSSFSTGEYTIYLDGNASINSLSVDNCHFLGNQYCFYLDINGVNNLNLSNNVFTGNEYAVISYPAIKEGVIANNQFIGTSYGALEFVTTTEFPSSLSIVNNTFTGNVVPSQGYNASIEPIPGSSICLDFFNNTSTPTYIGSNDPYYFHGTFGTLNVTARSTQANNIGTITTAGTIGSCSQ